MVREIQTMLYGIFIYSTGLGMLASTSVHSAQITSAGHLVALLASLFLIGCGSAGSRPLCGIDGRNQTNCVTLDGRTMDRKKAFSEIK